MYKIISDGEIVTLCDEPRYIKISPTSGCYIQTTKEEAVGLAARSMPFNLPGHTEITRIEIDDEEKGTTKTVTAPEAFVMEVDGGEVSFDTKNKVEESDGKIVVIDHSLTDTQMALCEVYEMLEGLDSGSSSGSEA